MPLDLHQASVLLAVFVNAQLFLVGPILVTLMGPPLDDLIAYPEQTFFVFWVFSFGLLFVAILVSRQKLLVLLTSQSAADS